MPEDYSQLNEEEQLKAENDFMKLKLMLEKGAQFGTAGEAELSPGMENEFLNYIMEYEKQASTQVTIKVFDKIGRPAQFKPMGEIAEEEIEQAWQSLSAYLEDYGISVDVCSPNIDARELYRFTTEELFHQDIEDINLPGYTTCFIYDEFHPDPIYESEKVVTKDLFPALFRTKPIDEYFLCLHDTDIFLNGKMYSNAEEVKVAFNRFKSFFSRLELQDTTIDEYNLINTTKLVLAGSCKICCQTAEDIKENYLHEKFRIELSPDDLGYWSITSMQIGTLAF